MFRKSMFALAALFMTVVALSTPRVSSAQSMLYYINVNSANKMQAGGIIFNCAVVKSPNSYGQLGRMTYSANGISLFSGETTLKAISATSATALFHTPVAGDYLAYTIVSINVVNGQTSVNMTKVNRSGKVLWSTVFKLDPITTVKLNPTPASN